MPLDVAQTERQIKSLNDSELSVFFTRLIYELTLSTRAIIGEKQRAEETIPALKEINEFQHLLSSQILNIYSGSPHRMTPDAIVSRFYSSDDSDLQIQHELRTAFEAAIDSIRK